jgi:hypothetical protein
LVNVRDRARRARVLSMNPFLVSACLMTARLVLLGVAAIIAATSFASAQPSGAPADPEKPVTAPDSYRVVMENDRMRMIEIHIRPHSKVNVDSPAERERFLYMLSDGALILAPPGKTPYEFALHAGETAVFPAVSPTVANDTDTAVRALMVEIKTSTRSAAAGRGKGARFAKVGKSRGKFAAKGGARKPVVASTKSKSKSKVAAKPRKQAAAKPAVNAPLNLRNANARPGRKVSGKRRGNDG